MLFRSIESFAARISSVLAWSRRYGSRRSRQRARIKNPILHRRMRRHSETLEERTLLTGGLTVDINGGADPFVRVDTAGDADVEFRGFDSSDDLALATFFSAADGAAVPTTVDASLSVDGRTITGTFTLDEFDSGNGVSIIAVDAGIQFGGPVGIELSDADGVFALLTSGLAGQITAEDVSDGDGIAVFGLAGLELDSAFGFDFQINTTDDAVDLSVDAPFGTQTISFATGGVHQLQGAAVFHVDSAIGRVVSTSADFTVTENGDGNLNIAAGDVKATLSAGDVDAVSLASATATFSLGEDAESGLPAFEMASGSFVVSGFSLLPTGNLDTEPDSETGEAGEFVLLKANLGPLSLSKVSVTFPTFSLIGDELTVGAGLKAKEASLSFKRKPSEAESMDDTMDGSGGDDTTTGSGGTDTTTGSGGDDTTTGSGGTDTTTGSGGDDTTTGSGGTDTTTGSGGDDTTTGSGGDDTTIGDDSSDETTDEAKPLTLVAKGAEGELQIRGNVSSSSGLIDLVLPGAFSLTASSVTLDVPDILEASASNVDLNFDPQLGFDQEIIRASVLTVAVPPLKLSGQAVSTNSNPALLVRGDGFAFGQTRVTLNETIQVSDILTVKNPFIEVSDFAVSIDTGVSVGGLAIGAALIEVRPLGDDAPWSLTGENVKAGITFNSDFGIDDVKFSANRLTGQLGEYLTVSTTDTTFVPTATGNEEFLRVAGAVSIDLSVAGVQIGGSLNRFAIEGDGDFKALNNFGASFSVGATSATDFGWVDVLPLSLDEVTLQWPDFNSAPEDFQIVISGSVGGMLPGGIAAVEGSIKGLTIEPLRLANGEFPVVAVDEISVSASGQFFGGEISGGLFGGVIKLDEEGIVTTGSNFAESVFYLGLQGSFAFPNLGETEIRVAFSELGPLGVYFSAGIPITVDPVFTGLTFNNFRGGVTFNAIPLVPPANPADLAESRFKPTLDLPFEVWRDRTRQQVANLATGNSGYRFDYSDPAGVSETILKLNARQFDKEGGFDASFANNGLSISDAAQGPTVKVLKVGSSWSLSFKGNEYIVEVVGELSGRKLRVTEATFKIDESLREELGEGGSVTQPLVDAFNAGGIRMSTAGTVEVLKRDDSTNTPTKWKIVDDGREYFVTLYSGTGVDIDLPGVLTVNGDTGKFEDMLLPSVRVEAGASVFSQFIGESSLNADVDIALTTEGAIVLNGKFNVGEKFNADLTLFADLSVIRADSEAPPRFVMLGDFPGESSGLPRVVRLQGDMFFEFLDDEGNTVNPLYNKDAIDSFRFRVLGRGEITALDFAKIVIGGDGGGSGGFASLELIASASPDGGDRIELAVQGSIGIEGIIPAGDLVSAAGRLIIDVPEGADPGDVEIYGVLKLDFTSDSPGLSFLADAGLQADAEILLGLNATNEDQTLDLLLPGRALETFVLEAGALAFELQGSLTMAKDLLGFGADLIFDGVFSMNVRLDENDPDNPFDDNIDFDMFMSARLDVDVRVPGQNLSLMTLDALGVFVARDVSPTQLIPKVAGRLDLTAARGLPGVFEISTGSPASLEFNTSGLEQTYVVPERLRDRLAVIQARRENVDMDDVTLPTTTIAPGGTITLAATPPPLLDGQTFVSGPYFFVTLGGNPADETDDAVITLFESFKLTGDFRFIASVTGGLELIVNARAGIALPGAENILSANAQGQLRISEPGIVGAITLDADFDIPGVDVTGDVFLGVNTTNTTEQVSLIATDGTTSSRNLAARSIEALVRGSLDVLDFELNGEFRLFTEGTDLKLNVDAGLEFFDLAEVRINETALIATGVDVGFDLSGALNDGLDVEFGQSGVFEAKAKLRLEINTLRNVAEIRVEDLELELLEVITLEGDGKVSAFRDPVTGESYLRLAGNLDGDLFNIANFRANGVYDSRGFVDVDFRGSLSLGTDDLGISADANFFLIKDETGFLDFGGSVSGRVRTPLGSVGGVDVDVDYDTDSGRIRVSAEVSFGVGLAKISKSVGFTVGYLRIGAEAFPVLGEKQITTDFISSNLILNVGDRGSLRRLEPGQAAEQYTITSLGPGTLKGEKLRVQAFGSQQVFDNIVSISGDFGSNNDELRITENVGSFSPLTINISGGSGSDQMVNESSSPVTFLGGAGNDLLVGGSGVDILLGEAGNDELIGGFGADLLRGGDGNDTITIEVAQGDDVTIDGDAGTDTIVIVGRDTAETYTLSRDGDDVLLAVTGGATLTLPVNAEELTIYARGGADSIIVPDLTGTTLTLVDASLGRISDNPTATGSSVDVAGRDDGARDSVSFSGDGAANSFNVSSVGDIVKVTREDGFRLELRDQTTGVDILRLHGGSGSDQFVIDGPMDGTGTAPGERLDIRLSGQDGDDLFMLPVGAATFNGDGGTDTALFRFADGDATDVRLTSSRITAGGLSSQTGGRVENVSIDSDIATDIVVQSTTTTTTSFTLNGGGTVDVQSTSGQIDLTLGGTSDLTTDVTLGSTGAPVNVIGGGSIDTVRVGTGLTNQIGGEVTVTGTDAVIYDNSDDGQSRAISVTGSTVNGLGNSVGFTHVGVGRIEVLLGSGDDTATFPIISSGISIDAGAGEDSVTGTLTGAPTTINPIDPTVASMTARNAELVTFLNDGNNDATNWQLDTGTDSGLLTADGVLVLDVADAVDLTATLGEADGNTLQLLRVNQELTLTLRGDNNAVTVGGTFNGTLATLDDIDRDVNFVTTGSGNTLTFDDSNGIGNDRQRDFVPGSVTGPDAGGTFSYDPAAFSAVDIQLGSANDRATIIGDATWRSVSGGEGNDSFNLTGDFGSVSVNGDAGRDVLTLSDGSGNVHFAGGEGVEDAAISDRSTVQTALTGNSFVSGVTAGEATLTVSGTPVLTLDTSDVENVTALLGAGNDDLLVNNLAFAVNFVANLGNGDDDVTIEAVTGPENSHFIDGRGGSDSVTIEIPGTPTSGQFLPLSLIADELILNNQTGTTDVDWIVSGANISANGNVLLSSDGVSNVLIQAGTGSNDSLSVTGTAASNRVQATIDSDRVRMVDGTGQFPLDTTVNNLQVTGELTGLTGVNSLVVSSSKSQPDYPEAVYAATDNGIVVLERTDQGLSPTQVFQADYLNDPEVLLYTRHTAADRGGAGALYVQARNANNVPVLLVFNPQLTADLPTLTLRQTIELDAPLIHLGATPNDRGQNVLASVPLHVFGVSSVTGTDTAFYYWSREEFSGRLTQDNGQSRNGNTFSNAVAAASNTKRAYIALSSGAIHKIDRDSRDSFGGGETFGGLTFNSAFTSADTDELAAVSSITHLIEGANNRLYATTSDGRLLTIRLNTSTSTYSIDSTLTDGVDGVSGLSSATSLIRSGNNLLITSDVAGDDNDAITRFELDGSDHPVFMEQLTDSPTTTLAGTSAVRVGPNGTGLYVASFDENAVTQIDFTGGMFGSITDTIQEGDEFSQEVPGIVDFATSPDGRFLYGVHSELFNSAPLASDILVVYDRQTGETSGAINGVTPLTLNDPDSIVASPVAPFVVVQSGDELVIFEQVGEELELRQQFSSAATVDLQDIAFAPDGTLYTLTSGGSSESGVPSSVSRLTLDEDGRPTVVQTRNFTFDHDFFSGDGFIFADAKSVIVSSPLAAEMHIFDADLSIAMPLQTIPLPTVGILEDDVFRFDVASFEDSIFVSTASNLEVASVSPDSEVLRVFQREADSTLTLAQTVTAAETGELGTLIGIAVRSDGTQVFAPSTGEDAIAVFSRDADTGLLTFQQSITQGRGGIRGLIEPVGVQVVGDELIIGTDQLLEEVDPFFEGVTPRLRTGGFTVIDLAPAGTPAQVELVTRFTGIEDLTVVTGDAEDQVSLRNAPVIPVSIQTGSGNDLVNLLDIDGSASVTVETGDGEDTINVNLDAALSSTGTLTISPQAGSDLVNVQSVGTASMTEIDVSGDAGTGDLIVTVEEGLPTAAMVNVTGDVATGTGIPDVLVFAGENGTVNPPGGSLPPDHLGTINAGAGVVSFEGFISNTSDPLQQVFLKTPPRPSINAFDAIDEGETLSLTAVDAANVANSFAWDLNGDGDFSDAFGASLSIPWVELFGLGVNDDGTYPIAVRAANNLDLVAFGQGTFAVSTDAVATLTVENVLPSIELRGEPSVDLGQPYELTIRVTDPGNDRVQQVTVDWGDGNIEQLGSQTTQATHTYLTVGDFSPEVTVIDEDGSASENFVLLPDSFFDHADPIEVRPSADGVSATGPYSVLEGDSVTLNATAIGTPVRFDWDLDGGGIDATSTDGILTLTWSELETLIAANGDQTFANVTVTAVYEDAGGTEFPVTSAATTLTITDVAPRGNLQLSTPSINEGSGTGAATLIVDGITDPSSLDLAGPYTVTYRIDGFTLPIDSQNRDPSVPYALPAEVFAGSGTLEILADLTGGGGTTTLSTGLAVLDILPTVTVTPSVSAVNEAESVMLTFTATDPGNDTVDSWVIDWGDGSALETFSGGVSSASHSYLDGNADFTIDVTAVGSEGSVTESLDITVNDVAPSVQLSTTSTGLLEGDPATPLTINLAITDPGLDTVSRFTIDWGDGTVETLPGTATTATHTYADSGVFNVSVTDVLNGDGSFENPSNTLTVTVGDVGPTIVDAALLIPQTGREGAAIFLQADAFGTQTGADPLTFNWLIERPDSSTFTLTGTVTPFAPAAGSGLSVARAFQGAAGFTPADNGTYIVTLTVTDDDGTSSSRMANIVVANVAPTIQTFVVPASGTEGQSVALSATASDPAGSADPLTFNWTVTHVATGDVLNLTGASTSFVPRGGNYSVRLNATDGDGGTATRTGLLSVAAVAPSLTTATLSVPSTAVEGETVSFNVAATDGDGTSNGLTFRWTVLAPNGTATILTGANPNFTFRDNGNYIVRVKVTDNEGLAVTSESQTVSVSNVAPQIQTVNVPASGVEDSGVTLTATASDAAGSRDPLSFIWTVTAPSGAIFEPGGPMATYIPREPGTHLVSLTVEDDDGGSTTASAGSLVVTATPPAVVSIERLTGAANPTSAGFVAFNVTFSEDVAFSADPSGVSRGDFVVDSTGLTGTAVTGLAGREGFGTVFTVTVATGSLLPGFAEGTLSIDFLADADSGVTDAGGNVTPSDFTDGQSYTIDKPAEVLSIERVGDERSNAASVDFLVTFSEPVTEVGVGDFVIDAESVSGATISNVSGTGSTRTVTVSTGSLNGELSIDFDPTADGSVLDSGGNLTTQEFSAGQSYLVDRRLPSPRISSPIEGPIESESFSVLFDFGEPVDGFGSEDPIIENGMVTGVTDNGDGTFEVEVTSTNAGEVTINLAAGAASDLSGNSSRGAAGLSLTVETLSVRVDGPSSKVDEGDDAVFVVSLSDVPDAPVSVLLSLDGGTATVAGDGTTGDFDPIAVPGLAVVVTFAPGETSKTVTVSTNQDGVNEPDEDFSLSIIGVNGATIEDGNDAAVAVIVGSELQIAPIADQRIAPGSGSVDLIVATASSEDAQATLSVGDLPSFVGFVDNGDGTGTFTFSPTDEDVESSRTITLTATDSNGSLSETFNVEVVDGETALPTPPLVRINSGGGAVGNFSGDQSFNTGSTFSTRATIDTSSVPEDVPVSIFQTTRYDTRGGSELQYSIPTGPGNFQVNLYFAEIYGPTSRIGARVFDVSIEGNLELDNFDVFATAGAANKAIVESFNVTSDGTIDILFGHVVENPDVMGIEIIDLNEIVNAGPALETINKVSVTAGNSTTIAVSASDSDGDSITLSADGLPEFVSFTDNGNGTGSFTVNSTSDDAGEHVITVLAESGEQPLTNSTSFLLTVDAVAEGGGGQAAPEFGGSVENGGTVTATNGVRIDGPSDPVTEGDDAVFTVSLDAPATDDVIVTLSVDDGSATVTDGDFLPLATAGVAPAIVFSSGEQSKLVSIKTLADQEGELDETFSVSLVSALGATIDDGHSSTTATIKGGSLAVSPIDDQTIAAGTGPVDLTFSSISSDGLPAMLSVNGLPNFASFTDNGDGTATLVFNPTESDVSNVSTIGITATDSNGSVMETFELNVVETEIVEQATSIIRINAGGEAIAGPAGNGDGAGNRDFSADSFANTGSRFSTAAAIDLSDPSLPENTPAALFQTTRWDPPGGAELNYSIPTGTGEFEVILYFAEIYGPTSRVGGRVFDVSINGQTVLENFDVFSEAGAANKAIARRFDVVSDGTLNIDFGHVVENPNIMAIEIIDRNPIPNVGPVVAPVSDQSVDEDGTLNIPVSAFDNDGDEIMLSILGLPEFASFTDNGDGTGSIAVNPSDGDDGDFLVSVNAESGEQGLTDGTALRISVADTLDSPEQG